MDRFDRIFELHKLLSSSRLPVSMRDLMSRLECSRATVNRVIEEMRLYLNAPIEYERARNGYRYAPLEDGQPMFELPGLWFNASELYALLLAQQLLEEVQPGLLAAHLAPLRARLEALLDSQQLGAGALSARVRIARQGARALPEDRFSGAAQALMEARRMRLVYHARGSDEQTEREVSPQRLLHYRDNWYLLAWCHLRQGMRSFALERVRSLQVLEKPAERLDEADLDAWMDAGFGIFSGSTSAWACLLFEAESARWVAEERWHPQQQGRWLEDGRFELRLPFTDMRELAMDVLRHGPNVEVLEPQALRERVAALLREAVSRYS